MRLDCAKADRFDVETSWHDEVKQEDYEKAHQVAK